LKDKLSASEKTNKALTNELNNSRKRVEDLEEELKKAKQKVRAMTDATSRFHTTIQQIVEGKSFNVCIITC
jgi:hypothetical protein